MKEAGRIVFPIKVVDRQVEEYEAFNYDLLAYVLELEKGPKTQNRSNAGGFHSLGNFFDTKEPSVAALKEKIFEQGRHMANIYGAREDQKYGNQLDGWTIINRDGHWNYPHVHPEAHFSGVYYITAPTPDDDAPAGHKGQLEFINPHIGGLMKFCSKLSLAERVILSPKEGRIVLFPAWLAHMVHPFKGKGVRAVVAFNIQVHALSVELVEKLQKAA